ncbi:MAG: hypothetical protein PHN64_00220 [Desulfovibrionaceae bacterium]|nr:hypothetical protein [Desulfovibrionaceae bacterium]
MALIYRLEPLTYIYDWLHSHWENPIVERRVACLIFIFFLLALMGIEINRQGWLPPSLAMLTPSNHFHAINLAFTLILGVEMMGLIMSLSISLSRSLGKQFEILALILLRDAFKELSHLPEPVAIGSNLDPLIHIGLYALGALAIFICLGFYYRLRLFQHYIQSPEMRMRYVLSKKLMGLGLFSIFTFIALRDLWVFFCTGQDQRFFETIYTVLLFSDVTLVLLSQHFMPSFHAVFRNSGFVIGTLLMRLSLSTNAPYDVAASIFAAVFVVVLTWSTSYFAPEAMKGKPNEISDTERGLAERKQAKQQEQKQKKYRKNNLRRRNT